MITHTWIHTHTHSPAKESPERPAVHTMFTAPLNYWSVVFLVLWEATQHGPLIKTAAGLFLSNRSAHYWPLSALLNRTVAFLGTVVIAWLLIHPVFLQFFLFAHLLSNPLPFFANSTSPSSLSPNQASQVQGAFIKWTADHAQQKVPPAIS